MNPFAGLRLLLIAGSTLLATHLEASADKRVALVIGNSTYQNVARLPNPANDADAVAELFKDAGFDTVSLQQDVGNLDFKRAIRKFEEAASDADIAVIYYAGHGIEIGGVNYLIPVDAKLASDLDAPDETIPLDRLVEAAGSARQLRLVILDACRDNPFVVNMKRQRLAGNRSISAGLSELEPTATGTLIAYAAKAGSTASDGAGEHSPFTTALLANLTTAGLDIRLAFGRVRDQVMKITNDRQEPFVYGSLGGATVSLLPAPVNTASSVTTTQGSAETRRDYEFFERVGTKAAWNAFLTLHGTGPYADLARAQLAKISDAAAAKRVPEPTPATQAPIAAAATPAARPEPAPTTPAGLARERSEDRTRSVSKPPPAETPRKQADITPSKHTDPPPHVEKPTRQVQRTTTNRSSGGGINANAIGTAVTIGGLVAGGLALGHALFGGGLFGR
jgi:uncharacterized caspase-like protein